MKCPECNFSVGGNICPVCGYTNKTQHPTQERTYGEISKLWRNLLFYDRVMQNHYISGPVWWFIALWIGIAFVIAPSSESTAFANICATICGWEMAFFMLFGVRKYLPKGGAITTAFLFVAFLAWGLSWGLVCSFARLPIIGIPIGCVCVLATAVPFFIVRIMRNRTLAKLRDTVYTADDWDKFAGEITLKYAAEQAKSIKQGHGLIPDMLYMRTDFTQKLVAVYADSLSDIYKPSIRR